MSVAGLCFAGLDALVPRVTKFRVISTSAVSEPRTTVTATTALPRFLDGTAFEAHGPDDYRRRDCLYLYMDIRQNKQQQNLVLHYRLHKQLHIIGF